MVTEINQYKLAKLMNKFYKPLFLLGLLLMSSACDKQVQPTIVPAVEVKQPDKNGLEVIGGVEPVYFLPMKTPFDARIDTGAETSSIDVSNMRMFERDGEKWVAFNLDHSGNGEKHRFEKRVKRKAAIRRAETDEVRVVVNMDVKIGNEFINADFTLANRERFNYQALIGRNIINGRFIVDPSVEKTLH